MQKTDFVAKYEEFVSNPKTYAIAVIVEMPDLEEPETITNSRANFEKKLSYYKQAYNNDMQLNNKTDIRITDVYPYI